MKKTQKVTSTIASLAIALGCGTIALTGLTACSSDTDEATNNIMIEEGDEDAANNNEAAHVDYSDDDATNNEVAENDYEFQGANAELNEELSSEYTKGEPLTFMRWIKADKTGFINVTDTPDFVESVDATWSDNGTFEFTTPNGTHINGRFTEIWDNQLQQYNVELWTDDGTEVVMPAEGGYATEDADGKLTNV